MDYGGQLQLSNPNRQSVTSFCTSDVAECKRIIQIGERGLLIGDPQNLSLTARNVAVFQPWLLTPTQ
jgi:hypothetical protein